MRVRDLRQCALHNQEALRQWLMPGDDCGQEGIGKHTEGAVSTEHGRVIQLTVMKSI